MPSSFALFTTAPASGCSLPCSMLAAIERKSFSDKFANTSISVTFGCPEVTVPVLSNTTVSTECSLSRLSADFIKIPYSAAFPIPTIIATGVASPSAHGHEMTSTDTAQLKANSKLCPAAIQHIAVKIAITITAGTNIPLMLSARRAIGAFELPASSTSLIILARVVSSPTFEARNLKLPFLFTVAERTSSPIFFSTGMLSPVIADWSTYP